jgi:hypothetical protein
MTAMHTTDENLETGVSVLTAGTTRRIIEARDGNGSIFAVGPVATDTGIERMCAKVEATGAEVIREIPLYSLAAFEANSRRLTARDNQAGDA